MGKTKLNNLINILTLSNHTCYICNVSLKSKVKGKDFFNNIIKNKKNKREKLEEENEITFYFTS